MTPKTPLTFLHDILDTCRAIERYVRNMSYDELEADEIRRVAVERKLAIIGEAIHRASRLDERLLEQISFARMLVDMRHRLIHGYDAVEFDALWEATTKQVPIVANEVAVLLRSEESV